MNNMMHSDTVVKYGVEFKKKGAEYINSLIENALNDKSRKIVVTGNWDIESHIRIPSDFTIVLDGCFLKMADNTFDNMFVNEHHETPLGNSPEGTDRNIKIVGTNGAIIDGGTYNGLSERNAGKDGMPPIRKNNLLIFTNVDGFEISGLEVNNFRWWAFHFLYCSNGHIHDIDFKADDTCIDSEGNVYHGLSLDRYFDMLIKNADGIDIRKGCHDIVIENIRGFCGDDVVALTCLSGGKRGIFAVEGYSDDISNITVRNIHACALDACVRILCQGGSLHDVVIDGVYDTSDRVRGIDGRILQAVRIGESDILYGAYQSDEKTCYNVTVKNVRSRGVYAMYLGGNPIGNFVYENIRTFDDGGYIDNHWNDENRNEKLKVWSKSKDSTSVKYGNVFKVGGYDYINKLIEAALEEGKKEVVLTENYDIEKSVFLPDGFTLILDGCMLKLSDKSEGQMFVAKNEYGKNIKIIGKNGATIFEKDYKGNSIAHTLPIEDNILLGFSKVEDFDVDGVELKISRN